MSLRIRFSYIYKPLLIFAIFILSTLSAYASNTLLGIEVEQKDSNYNIILKTDSAVDVKRAEYYDEGLSVFLNSVSPSDSVEIVYDNTKDLKNVTVQKKNSDNTVVILQGKNIQNSNIFIKEISTGTLKKIDADNKSLNGIFYIADNKYLTIIIAGSIFLFMLMLISRPRNKKYSIKNVQKVQLKKKITINSLKNAPSDKRFVPSINYKIRPVYSYMSIPNELASDNYNDYDEEIRKAG